ncbi:uncharacterized protein LOC116024402 [Ipomoea triloba]|uniref:uncharacterized protein LOC116024402 n=1 Tax=Ipomoea triloba TaxID=35885 RepID=UPI00125E4BDF|nr:uncharacterized protein LOC116024402 [Ipomoea triloba]
MAAHDLVCGGVRRRIGDGRSTLIWGHPWLPDNPTPMVQTPMPIHLNGTCVSSLIDTGTNSWNIPLLNDIFTVEDALRISRIPISPGYEDSWYWQGDPKGCYTVKCGYKAALGEYSASEDHIRVIVAALYHLWKARNTAVWDAYLLRPAKVLSTAVVALHAWKEVHDKHQPTAGNTLPPPADQTQTMVPKCYFDAGFCSATHKASFGAVLISPAGSSSQHVQVHYRAA